VGSAVGVDVVLTDINMPGGSGCDLAHWLADKCPRTRTILMSSQFTECENCPLIKRCPFLLKPLQVPYTIAFADQLIGSPQRDS